MSKSMSLSLAFALLAAAPASMGHEPGVTKPQLLLKEIAQDMPQGERQEVRVLTASFKPGDKTVFHTHRFPVTVYVLDPTGSTSATPGTPLTGATAATETDRLTEVACVDVPAGEKRPAFGCFNVRTVRGLNFVSREVFWHLRTYPSVEAANAARTTNGVVVEEDGQVWLSEFGTRDSAPQGGVAVAVIGPMRLPAAKSYSAVLSYAVMRPGDSSRVHTHAGPEAWYVIAGEQCLETPAGATTLRAGEGSAVEADIPMKLNVTGSTIRHAFALVIHDSSKPRGTPSQWKPPGSCGR
jgi:quercetin dioxygenase-like cupin family protein